ncbi:MAG: ATP-binding cassette domain-containing protein [Cyanobacteriota bacterium]
MSGSGKTSLLNIVAGRAASRGLIKIDADVRLNNFKVDPTNMKVRKHIAFVVQDDSLQVTSTPREALYFSAKLRLPRGTPENNFGQSCQQDVGRTRFGALCRHLRRRCATQRDFRRIKKENVCRSRACCATGHGVP